MKSKLVTLLAAAGILLGIVILAYPMVSNMQFRSSQQELAEYYENSIKDIAPTEINSMLEDCYEYNEQLLNSKVRLTDPFQNEKERLEEHPYIDLLNQNGDGAMGILEIPAIKSKLAVYHYTDEEVLAKGIGHLQGTSLPVGGKGTHCVLSGHTGTADKELFTNLDQLREGDVFYINTLGNILAYKVDQIQVVLPEETEGLYIDREKDYVTLVTCTPYGINSHRLLVRGERIEYEEAKQIENTQGTFIAHTWTKQYIYAIIVGVLLSIGVIIAIIVIYRRILNKKTPESTTENTDKAAEENSEQTNDEKID